MPVNFQQIRTQIKEMGDHTQEYEHSLSTKLNVAKQLLEENHDQNEKLREKVTLALRKVGRLRCAVPVNEPLDAAIPPTEGELPGCILAADGSQIMPDPHGAHFFGVINVGILKYYPDQMKSPEEVASTQLLYHDALYNDSGGLINDDAISLMRDLQERQLLAELAEEATPPVVTMTDGPIELYHEPADAKSPDPSFLEYLQILKNLAKVKTMTAGYVDRPRADLLVRLLELSKIDEQTSENDIRNHSLQGITDASLLEPILPPGCRSAVFELQSASSKFFTDEIALHFFYLNIGTNNHPGLARVEIPAWLGEDAPSLEMLHRTLLSQCQQMANTPYPYVLIRAHEIALLTFEDKDYLENMIGIELLKHNAALGIKSNKQSLKDLV
jgi:hypothetical protein